MSEQNEIMSIIANEFPVILEEEENYSWQNFYYSNSNEEMPPADWPNELAPTTFEPPKICKNFAKKIFYII
jgi:hypothetical protein